ncbi:MAG TPA: tetratricopeptide repeat protein, partial [Pyrinomonadaceae bacterium]|nr:tetratricopeptide repeat protein [Pyrinomonadaceae bacterium]
RKVDLDVPSPGQFDHVITVVPRGNDLVWLDTTPEVAPFAVLLGNLRDKQALVIPTEKAASMMKTPEIPPIASRLTFNADGKLGPDGTLTAHVERTAGGDVAIVYRIEFRRVPQVRWKELVQQISYSSGFAGEVSAVDASPPDDIDQLFRFSYDYTRKNYGDWENRRVTLPLPPFGIELSGTEEKKPTEPPFLGSPGERVSQARIELPSGSTAIIPEKVDVTQDFAEYHATYSFTNGTLTAERRLVIKKAEVPLIAWDKYQNFRKVVTDDRDRWIQLDGLEGKSATAKTSDSEGESKVEQLLDQAYSANQAGEYQTALNLYGEALKLDPKHPTAWNDIGRMQLRLGLTSEAIKSLQRQVAINPQDEFVYRNLARAYLALGDDEQAKTACLTQIRMRPLDDFCNLIVGRILVEQRKYSEAIPLLETAARIMPNEPTIPLDLGIARLYLGDNDAAYRDFKRALDMGKIPFIWIGVANALSDRGLRPDEALQYATSAADVTAGLLQAMIQQKQYKDAWALSEELVLAWDSVALAQFRRRELAKAEKFASSAWNNRLFAETGHHLGVIYEAMGAPNRAANVYEDVLLYFPKSPLTQTRLQTILGGQQEAEAALKARRSSALSPVLVLSTTAQDDASDDVWLLLGSHGSVVDLQFVEIAHSLDRFTDAIRAHKFEADIVDDKTPALVRRGRVACSRQGGCTFFLLPGGLNESVSGIERDLAGTARK